MQQQQQKQQQQQQSKQNCDERMSCVMLKIWNTPLVFLYTFLKCDLTCSRQFSKLGKFWLRDNCIYKTETVAQMHSFFSVCSKCWLFFIYSFSFCFFASRLPFKNKRIIVIFVRFILFVSFFCSLMLVISFVRWSANAMEHCTKMTFAKSLCSYT